MKFSQADCEGKVVERSVPSPPENKDVVIKEKEKEVKEQGVKEERVKVEVCLIEEGKGKEEEQKIDVWEEEMKGVMGEQDFGISMREKERD